MVPVQTGCWDHSCCRHPAIMSVSTGAGIPTPGVLSSCSSHRSTGRRETARSGAYSGAVRVTAGPADLSHLPPFSVSRVFTEWGLDPVLSVASVVVTGLYLYGVQVLRARGDSWPVSRTLSFVVLGMGGFFFVTSSGLAAYDTTLLSVHMVQHMALSMMVPLFLALGAPVTLMLRTLPQRPRGWLLALLHSRMAKVLSFAPLAFLLFVVSPWALYFTGWYDASLRSLFVHEMMHVHLVLVGSLFFWPLVGVDPVPGRVAYPFRLLLVFLTLPFHAFLGVTIMNQQQLVAGAWYRSLHRSDGMAWLPDPLADQHVAGGILWGAGDLVGLAFFGVLFVQWVRASMREATREDRRLDRLEARAAVRRTPSDGE
jgi:cytochrome c oxidase assembly factor CtaG